MQYYDYDFTKESSVAELSTLVPYKTDYVNSIYYPPTSGSFITSGRNDYVAALFEGYLQYPSSDYGPTFKMCVASDDLSYVYANDELIIDNGFGAYTKKCAVIKSTGLVTKMRVEFFVDRIDLLVALMIEWLLPDEAEYQPIPISAWVHPSLYQEPTTNMTEGSVSIDDAISKD